MQQIGLLVIATSELYVKYAKSMIASADRHFFTASGAFQITYFVFSDTSEQLISGRAGRKIVQTHISHQAWPQITLQRYSIFVQNEHLFKKMDYLFYCDADMLFQASVDKEILAPLVVVIHPAYKGTRGTPETRPQSTAFVADNEKMSYVCGGFNGGERQQYMNMARAIMKNTNTDTENGIIAVWHDESHLNKYIVNIRKTWITPLVKFLSSVYCYAPEHDPKKLKKGRLCTVYKGKHVDATKKAAVGEQNI